MHKFIYCAKIWAGKRADKVKVHKKILGVIFFFIPKTRQKEKNA